LTTSLHSFVSKVPVVKEPVRGLVFVVLSADFAHPDSLAAIAHQTRGQVRVQPEVKALKAAAALREKQDKER
jgi:hypothetical protein